MGRGGPEEISHLYLPIIIVNFVKKGLLLKNSWRKYFMNMGRIILFGKRTLKKRIFMWP